MPVKLNNSDRLPNRIYFVTSDGKEELPSPDCFIHFILDENIHLRLDRLDWPPMVNLRKWLEQRHRRISSVMTSVAIEHLISAKKSHCASELRSEAVNLSSKSLRKNSNSLDVVGPGSVWDVLFQQAANAYFSCAEITWVRARISKDDKKQAFSNCMEFLQWRGEHAIRGGPTASTLYCLLSLGGNQVAAEVLKIKKKDTKEVVNGVFDACHADGFINVSRMVLNQKERHPSVAVFATADAGLAALCKLVLSRQGDNIRAGLNLETPYLGKSKAKAVRDGFHHQADAGTGAVFDLGLLVENLNSASRVVAGMYEGDVPERISRLRRLCFGLAQKCAEERGRPKPRYG